MALRPGPGGPEVLLGRRGAKARFMPGVYVFPGGRLDPVDRQPSGFREAPVACPAGLDLETRRALEGFARAALRETAEETGLLIGRPGKPPQPAASAPPVWRLYAAAGLIPAFNSLRLVARAITPATSPIRFHTRFFLCPVEDVEVTLAASGDGELEDISWRPVEALAGLPMSSVTRSILAEALLRLHEPGDLPASLLLYRQNGGRQRLLRRGPALPPWRWGPSNHVDASP